MTERLRRWSLLVVVGLLLAGSPARAQEQSRAEPGSATAQGVAGAQATPPPALAAEEKSPLAPTSSDYETALARALEAYASGDFTAAHSFLERAHALEPSARTLRGLGIVAFAQARPVEAIGYLEAALASEVKPLPLELRAGVEELLTHAWGQVGRFEIAIEPGPGDFLVDGRRPELFAPNTVLLMPGAHVLTLRAPGHAAHRLELSVTPGDRRSLHIVLVASPERETGAGAEVAAKPSAAAEQPGFWTKRARRITWTSAGLLLAAGSVVYATAYARLGQVEERCRGMADAACTPQQASALYEEKDVKALGIAAISVLGAGALVGLTAAGIELSVKLKSDRKRSAQLGFGPSQLFVHGTF